MTKRTKAVKATKEEVKYLAIMWGLLSCSNHPIETPKAIAAMKRIEYVLKRGEHMTAWRKASQSGSTVDGLLSQILPQSGRKKIKR